MEAIAASCCVGHIWMLGGGGGCSYMLLHPVPTSADAGPNLCILYIYILSFGPCACGVSLLPN